MVAFSATRRRDFLSYFTTATFICLVFAARAAAHEHHEDNIPEGQVVSPDPIDSILWIHIAIQVLAWGLVFPAGMVLGIVRSKWHVPFQSLGVMLAIAGYILGHKHGGRQFAPNVHATFALALGWMLAAQVIIGIYLKLHIEKGFLGQMRRFVVPVHGVIGKVMPVVSWVQMLFGGITGMGFCRADHFGQCLAHFIMGSAFIGYGISLIIILLVGQHWLRRTGRSQEFFDSTLIAAWGCVNTFTEHRWGQPWGGNDLQHTSMGVVWWAAGLLGMWLSRRRDGRPKRNIVPAIVLIITGWAMSAHAQHLMLSTMMHSIFGYTLMGAGFARIIEIAFVLKDQQSLSEKDMDSNSSFQMLTPFLLMASGVLFMGSTEEQLQLFSDLHVTHVSYVLLLYSVAFALFLYVAVLLNIYANHTWPPTKPIMLKDEPTLNGVAGGMNGHTRDRDPRVRDVEEFELEGLMSEDEDAPLVGDQKAKTGV